jgi:hypothetical protein
MVPLVVQTVVRDIVRDDEVHEDMDNLDFYDKHIGVSAAPAL